MKNEMGVGKYFDPAVFDAFTKGFDDIMTIKNHYKVSTR
jgi:response regulator RpfG family c-di-GMP phosphodiesterase